MAGTFNITWTDRRIRIHMAIIGCLGMGVRLCRCLRACMCEIDGACARACARMCDLSGGGVCMPA